MTAHSPAKNSIEWADSLPDHWKHARLRWLSRIFAGGTPNKAVVEYWQDGTIPWLASGAINQRTITAATAYITPEAFDSSSAKWIKPGSLLMALAGQGKTKGMVARLAFPATCNQSMAAMEVETPQFSDYLYWWLYSNYQNIRNMAGGDLRDGLNLQLLGDIACPLPPRNEAKAIADFLDRETAKIDALIEEQEKLISLLQEKRQAVISHAVTKGLDPDVPMKPSGIDWLGDIPAHWGRTRVKHACSHISDCLHTTPHYDGEIKYPAIRTADLKPGVLDLSQARLVSRDVYEERTVRLVPKANDVLYSREGERFGMAALVPEGVELCLGQRMMLFRTNQSMFSDYFMWSLNSSAVVNQVQEKVAGATSPHINISDIRNFHLPEPPFEEQGQIARVISNSVSQMDECSDEAIAMVQLLKERRAALISAAVTGKIDVRGLAAQTEKQTEEVAA